MHTCTQHTGAVRQLVYRVQTSSVWAGLVIASAVVHACLIFWEPLTFRESGARWYLALCVTVCL